MYFLSCSYALCYGPNVKIQDLTPLVFLIERKGEEVKGKEVKRGKIWDEVVSNNDQ